MGRKAREDLGGSVTKADLQKRLVDIEKEKAKLDEEAAHITKQINDLEVKMIQEQIDLDKVVMFMHKKEETFGKITAIRKDGVEVNLCSMSGEELQRPEGSKRFKLVANIKYSEIMNVQ